MHPFPLLALALTMAVATGIAIDPENWFGDRAVLIAIVCVAVSVIAFNWWELWATRASTDS